MRPGGQRRPEPGRASVAAGRGQQRRQRRHLSAALRAPPCRTVNLFDPLAPSRCGAGVCSEVSRGRAPRCRCCWSCGRRWGSARHRFPKATEIRVPGWLGNALHGLKQTSASFTELSWQPEHPGRVLGGQSPAQAAPKAWWDPEPPAWAVPAATPLPGCGRRAVTDRASPGRASALGLCVPGSAVLPSGLQRPLGCRTLPAPRGRCLLRCCPPRGTGAGAGITGSGCDPGEARRI